MGSRKARPPLDQQRLGELALRYVGRFATTRVRLRAYLERKIRERGWDAPRPPDVEAIADRFADLGYVDDAGYALAKSRALAGRGYGKRRVTEALRVAGIADEDCAAAQAHAEAEQVAAALRFAEKRRIGPFGEPGRCDPRRNEKALGAMVRAGHPFDLARAILSLPPGEPFDVEELSTR
jgi:regulatory protein